MGMTYPWASPKYLLNEMSLEEIFFYYDWARGLIEGKPAGINKNKPNKEKFHKLYPDKIQKGGSN